MDMNKLMREMELKAYRNSRRDELQNMINRSSFQNVMYKTVSFLTDGAAEKITLKITTGDESFTDGKNITLGIDDYFFDPDFTSSDWVTVFKALLAHEVQHINSSNFTDIKDIRKKYVGIMAGKGIPDKVLEQIAQDMLNIMEDGRIENIIVHKYPGYRLPLLMLNQSITELSVLDEAADKPGQEFLDFVNTCLCYTKTGRLPVGISVYAGTRFEAEFKNVQALFDLAVDARTSGRCKNICLKMLKLTADYFSELLKEEEAQQMAQQMAQQNGGQAGEYTSSEETEYNDSPNGTPQERIDAEASVEKRDEAGKPARQGSKSDRQDEKKEDNKPLVGGSGDQKDQSGSDTQEGSDGQTRSNTQEGQSGQSDSYGQDGQKSNQWAGNKTGKNALRLPRDPNRRCGTEDWTDDFSGNGAEDYQTRQLTAEELAALRRGVTDELDAVEVEEDAPVKRDSQAEKKDVEMSKIEEKYKSEYIRTFSEVYPTIRISPLPSEHERIARRLENMFEQVIRTKRSEKRNMRIGTVSSRDLYRVRMRDPHVFMKKGQPMKADLAVFLLLDNSGSMSGQGAMMDVDGKKIYIDKSTLSRTAAGIIERSLSKFAAIKISLFDVSGGVIRHATVKRFDERVNGSKCYNSIQPLGTGGGNKDGYSIRVATKDLLTRRESKKVLVVLSDGLPSDYNGGTRAGMDDVKEAIREARRKGIVVIPIMFGRVSDREKMKDNFSYMYGQYISSDPVDITDEFKKLFVKLINRS